MLKRVVWWERERVRCERGLWCERVSYCVKGGDMVWKRTEGICCERVWCEREYGVREGRGYGVKGEGYVMKEKGGRISWKRLGVREVGMVWKRGYGVKENGVGILGVKEGEVRCERMKEEGGSMVWEYDECGEKDKCDEKRWIQKWWSEREGWEYGVSIKDENGMKVKVRLGRVKDEREEREKRREVWVERRRGYMV